MKIYVYCLIDPRNSEPFYIGCGSKSRPKASSRFAPYETTMKNIRIKSINKDSLVPTIQILKICKTKDEGLNWERYYIAIIGRKDLGKGPLLNETDGGNGIFNASERIKKKKSKSSLGRPKSESHRKAIAKGLSGKPKSEEHIRKNSESHRGLVQSEESKRKKSETMKRRLKEYPRAKDLKGRFI